MQYYDLNCCCKNTKSFENYYNHFMIYYIKNLGWEISFELIKGVHVTLVRWIFFICYTFICFFFLCCRINQSYVHCKFNRSNEYYCKISSIVSTEYTFDYLHQKLIFCLLESGLPQIFFLLENDSLPRPSVHAKND